VDLGADIRREGKHGHDIATDTMNRLVPASLLLLLPETLAAQGTLSVTVFDDHDGNGAREAGERAIPNVAISNQRDNRNDRRIRRRAPSASFTRPLLTSHPRSSIVTAVCASSSIRYDLISPSLPVI
jgi:hypothetical protein